MSANTNFDRVMESIKLYIHQMLTRQSDAINNQLNFYMKKENLAKVARTNDYRDLDNKPKIPSIDGLASTLYVDEKINKFLTSDAKLLLSYDASIGELIISPGYNSGSIVDYNQNNGNLRIIE